MGDGDGGGCDGDGDVDGNGCDVVVDVDGNGCDGDGDVGLWPVFSFTLPVPNINDHQG